MVWLLWLGMGRGPYKQGSTSRHGIQCILDQVVKYFLELLDIGIDLPDFAAPFGHQGYLPAFEFRPEERDTFRDAGIQIERRSNRLRSPGVQQHVLNNFRCSFDLNLHCLQPFSRFLTQSWIFGQELDMTEQRGQGSANLMCHGCGNLPDGRETLRTCCI